MLFSCLLLPRVPINNPSRSEMARLLLRGESWVLAVIFLLQLKGPFPFLPAVHLVAACSLSKVALRESSFSSDVGSGLRGAPAAGRTAPRQPWLSGTGIVAGAFSLPPCC